MVALRSTDIVTVSIADAVHELNRVPDSRYEEAAILFG
jgi:6-phosphofructokinase 1